MKLFRTRKTSEQGFSLHFVLPVLAIIGVAAIGTYLLRGSRAATVGYANGFIDYNNTMQIGPDGRNKAQYNGFSAQATYSPDGTKAVFAFINGNSITGINATSAGNRDAASQHTVLTLPSGSVIGSNAPGIAWSQDDNWLAFGVATSNGSGGWTYPYSIGLVHPDGTGYTTVPDLSLNDSDGFYGVSWLPDSQTLLYLKSNQICTVKMDGTDNACKDLPVNVQGYNNYSDPQVSADGDEVLLTGYTGVYHSAAGDQQWSDVYEANVDGTNMHALTKVPPKSDTQTYLNSAGAARWSPDGKLIAYGVGGDPALAGLYLMNPDGSNPVKLDTAQGYNIAWQPVAQGDEPVIIGSCSVANVAALPAYGAVLTPSYTIKNTTSHDISVSLTEYRYYAASTSGSSWYKAYGSPVTIAAGASLTVKSQDAYSVPYTSSSYSAGMYQLAVAGKNSNQNFSCTSNTFKLPAAPTYLGSCTVQGVPASIKKGTAFTAKVQIKNSGTGAWKPTLNATWAPNAGSAYKYAAKVFTTNLAPGASTTWSFASYTVPKTTTATSATVKATVTGATGAITCNSAAMKITN